MCFSSQRGNDAGLDQGERSWASGHPGPFSLGGGANSKSGQIVTSMCMDEQNSLGLQLSEISGSTLAIHIFPVKNFSIPISNV